MVIMGTDEKDRTIFCGNLHNTITEELLYELFLQAGPLEKVTIATEKDGRKKGFGFITFKHVDSVPYTIQLMNGIQLLDRRLNLQIRPGSVHEQKQREMQEVSSNHFRPGMNQHMSMQPMAGPPIIPTQLHVGIAPAFSRSASMPENLAQAYPMNGPPPYLNSVPNSHSGSNSPAENRFASRPAHPLLQAAPGQRFQFPLSERLHQESRQYEVQRQQFMSELDRQLSDAQNRGPHNRGSQAYQPYPERHENLGRSRESSRQGDRDYRQVDADYRSPEHDYRGSREPPGYRRQERRENRNYDNRRRH